MKQLGKWFNPKTVIAIIMAILFIWLLKFLPKKSLTPHEAIAEAQFSAMRDYATDEETLFRTLEGLTPPDLRAVFSSFGLRTYESGGKGLNLIIFKIGKKLDLFGWYSAELTEKERKKMRSIWGKSGLKLTF